MTSPQSFTSLGLSTKIASALKEIGYEAPTPVQAQCIPILLSGQDLLGQAQTGTGKTAAFALPILNNLSLEINAPQALVLAPTRELAIQVAEAFQSYAKHLPGFHVLPIYGGQDYTGQLKALKRGVHVIVATPGRIMDHMRRGKIDLSNLKMLVLDEADEMLNMGFIDDVEWILQQMEGEHQTALFSATMPPSIRQVAQKYLIDPGKVHIQPKQRTVDTIQQKYILVANHNKMEVLTRYLEIEDADATLVFTRTKNASSELAEKLAARGYNAAALNGDMNQSLREKVIDRLKRKSLDIVIATEVAARGLDVERISHVINYDIPYDPESYIHRIGRTGRAGRSGSALLLVTPRERHLLRDIERALGILIEMMDPPSMGQISKRRAENFKSQVLEILEHKDLNGYREFVETLMQQSESSELDIAAALACLAQKEKPLDGVEKVNFSTKEDPKKRDRNDRDDRRGEKRERGRGDRDREERGRGERARGERSRGERDTGERERSVRATTSSERGRGERDRGERSRGERDTGERDRGERRSRDDRSERSFKGDRDTELKRVEPGMIRCRIDVGRDDGVQPRDVVGVIANKSGVSGKSVGAIRIFDDYTVVDLEKTVYKQVIESIYTVKLKQQQTRIRPLDEVDAPVAKKIKIKFVEKR